MKLRKMGATGLRVSELCLGTMNFGQTDWGVDEKASLEIFHAFFEAGGNFIDTADAYTGGVSEEICAKAVAGRRDGIVIATKGYFPVTKRFGEPPAHVNALGSSRRHLTAALEGSLKRLKTDYIDLYQVHCWDAVTPLQETLSTLDDFVRSGKVRYVGLSNYDSWQIVESRQLCIRYNWEPFVTAQMQYSLVCRDIERGVLPVCERYGIGILPWSPLGGGVLTGKYKRDLTGPKGSRYGEKDDPANDWRKRFMNERNMDIAEAVGVVAKELGTSTTAVAVGWLLERPAVSSVIIGPKTIPQLRDNMAGCEVKFTPESLERLEKASRPVNTYPEWFIARSVRNLAE